MFRQRKFSGDPHPGNLLRLFDGNVAFMDFGLFKEMEPEPIELELACQRAIAENDESELHSLLARNGFLPDPARVDPTELRGRETLAVFGVGAFAVVCCAGIPAVLTFVGGATMVGLLGGGLLAIALVGCAALIVVRTRRRRHCLQLPQRDRAT